MTKVSRKKSKASSAHPRKQARNVARCTGVNERNNRHACIDRSFTGRYPEPQTMLSCWMRYLVKARVKEGQAAQLAEAIRKETLGRGSIAGDEYLHDMRTARLNANDEALWGETCFCDPPLDEERPYWEQYFHLLAVKDAHSRRNCRHENGTEPCACCDCDCTRRLEEKLSRTGVSFLEHLPAEHS